MDNGRERAAIQEVGSTTGRAVLHFLIKHVGLWTIKIINFPVVCYFMLAKREIRNNALSYWKAIYPNRSLWFYIQSIYKQYTLFGETLIDRIILQQNINNSLNLTNDQGQQIIKNELDQNRGVMLLVSHIGGYNLYRYLRGFINKPIHIMMYESDNKKLQKAYSMADRTDYGDIHFIDPVDPMSAAFEAVKALSNHEILAIMGDRVINESDKYNKQVQIAGMKIKIPLGPYHIAFAARASIIIIFIVKQGKEYQFIVENPIVLDKTKSKSKSKIIDQAAKMYAKKLENIIKQYPQQWFNFSIRIEE